MRKLLIIFFISVFGILIYAQSSNPSEIKIKISIDSTKNIDTVIQISSIAHIEELEEYISNITIDAEKYGGIGLNWSEFNDSVFDFDVDVQVDLKGMDKYIDSILSEDLQHFDFDIEFDEEMDEELMKEIQKHIIIEKSICDKEGEKIIIYKDEDGNENKIIIKTDKDNYYKYHKDSDIETEDEDAVK